MTLHGVEAATVDCVHFPQVHNPDRFRATHRREVQKCGYERNQRILQGIYEVTGDLPEELMGRDRGQCVVRISCARGGVGSSISGAPHGSEWMSRYLLFSFQWTFVFVPVDLCAPVPRDLCAFLNATLRQYRRTTVRF